MCQLPPDSHMASASQFSPLLGAAGLGATFVPMRTTLGCAAVTTWVRCVVRPDSRPLM